MPDRPKSFLNTRLWKQFEKKAKMERELISAVQALCSAAEELSKMIPRLFPDFTLHDGTHAAGVCEWMDQLLMKLRDQASAEELAVLLMAACCHDLGMVVREKEEAALLREAESGTCPEWESFFRRWPQDRERLNGDERQRRSLLRRYVRETHHLRLRELFPRELSAEWDRVKDRVSLTLDEFCALCESHGSSLPYLESPAEELDLNLCAVLLRLADALDYDAARAPAILYRFLGLDKAEDLHAEELEKQISSEEWKKNRAGRFIRSTQAQLRYAADCWEPRLEVELTEYCGWLKKELETCCRHLEEHSRRWCGSSNPVPLLLDVKFTRKNYASAKFRLKLDQDGVLKLLSGDELYDDNTVFVRELLQNAIDAVLARRACDPDFGENDGRITVDVWTDERYCWFRIQDDGIGMNQEAIEQYFLNVGHSYYSDENGLKRDLLLSKKDTSFQPISRFGIGILSCFMGGGNHNRLEVSTRRWSESGAAKNPALRLDVTGLHGYYFLTELSRETPGEPMHGPGGPEREAYLREVGTTVSVCIDLLELGAIDFPALLDKYICFPDVPIHFEDHVSGKARDYPTQGELEALLDRLNPEFAAAGEARVYRFPMPEEAFQSLQAALPDADWSGAHRPCLTRTYYPLRRMSGTEELSGALIRIDDDEQRIYCLLGLLLARLDDGSEAWAELKRRVEVSGSYVKITMRFQEISFGQFQFSTTIDTTDTTLSSADAWRIRSQLGALIGQFKTRCACRLAEDEAALRRLIDEGGGVVSAYNGIRAGENRVDGRVGVLLLSGACRPEVGLAREGIKSLPFDAACGLALLLWRCGVDDSPYEPTRLRARPASDFFAYLAAHREAADALLRFAGVPGDAPAQGETLRLPFHPDNMLDQLKAAALKQAGYVLLKLDKMAWNLREPTLSLTKDKDDGFDAEGCFPAWLFYRAAGADDFAVGIFFPSARHLYSCLSRSHPFSVWLIGNRERLQAEAPAAYDRLLDGLTGGGRPQDMAKRLNDELDRLRALSGNPFRVPPKLRIFSEEFETYWRTI